MFTAPLVLTITGEPRNKRIMVPAGPGAACYDEVSMDVDRESGTIGSLRLEAGTFVSLRFELVEQLAGALECAIDVAVKIGTTEF